MGMEALARAMGGNLTYDAEHEREWDRLTAMALGSHIQRPARESVLNALGVSLIGLKHKGRIDLHKRSVDGLRDCLRWRTKMGREHRVKVAEAAIQEWVEDACETCRGAREVFDTLGICRACLVCHGSGKRRYSDTERPFGNKHMDSAHFLISFAVGMAVRDAVARLK